MWGLKNTFEAVQRLAYGGSGTRLLSDTIKRTSLK